jgi:cell division septation protein DedD
MRNDWTSLEGVTAAVRAQPAHYYAVWHGTPDLMAVLVTTTRSRAKAERLVARLAAAGQQAYITTETGCLNTTTEEE